jgi:hypothetical protein
MAINEAQAKIDREYEAMKSPGAKAQFVRKLKKAGMAMPTRMGSAAKYADQDRLIAEIKALAAKPAIKAAA